MAKNFARDKQKKRKTKPRNELHLRRGRSLPQRLNLRLSLRHISCFGFD